MKQRYQYGEKSSAGFVELRPDCEMTGKQLFDALGNVPGVLRVEWQKEKANAREWFSKPLHAAKCDCVF